MNKLLFPIAVAFLLCTATTQAQSTTSPDAFTDKFTIGTALDIGALPVAFSVGYKVAID